MAIKKASRPIPKKALPTPGNPKHKATGKKPELISSKSMTNALTTLANTYDEHPMGILTENGPARTTQTTHDPYKVLIACILSLRTKDETMIPASERLFALADTPEKMVKLSPAMVEKLIFPVGFYKTKAVTVLEISKRLISEYQSVVPNTIDELLTFKGVGRKTANLVVGLGYGLPAICVDVHVHRICNRMGYIQTKDPEETETVLRGKLPQPFWPVINKVLVLHGQQICRPIGPHCDSCPVATVCQKIDVIPRKTKTKITS